MRYTLLFPAALLGITLQMGCGSSDRSRSDKTDGQTGNNQQVCDGDNCPKVPASSVDYPASPTQTQPGPLSPNGPAHGGSPTLDSDEIALQKLALSYCTAQPLANFEAEEHQFLKTQRYLVTYFGRSPSLIVAVDGEWNAVSVDAAKIDAKCDTSTAKKVLMREAKIYRSARFDQPAACILPAGYEFGGNVSYAYSSESYATLSFNGMEKVCNDVATGYSQHQIVFFNLAKSLVQPPVVQPPVVQPPVVQPPVVQPPVVQPPVVQPPAVEPDCDDSYLARFSAAYQYAFGVSGLNLTADAAREFASMAVDKTCAHPQWLDSFKDARSYAYSVSGMNSTSSAAYDFGILAADKEIASKGWLAVFKDARSYAYSVSGMNSTSSASYDFGILAANREAASKGWLAVFKDARNYAYSVSGMNATTSQAYDFALLAADKETASKGWLAAFKDARSYAYSVSGMNFTVSQAHEFGLLAANNTVTKPNWFQKFKDAYTYAYSVSGLNLSSKAAYDFALKAADR